MSKSVCMYVLSIIIFVVANCLHGATIQDTDISKGDWVKFNFGANRVPAAGKVQVVQSGRVIVSYKKPNTNEMTRLAIENDSWEKISKDEAEKINSLLEDEKSNSFRVGQMVRVNYQGDWFDAEISDIPNNKHFLIKYFDSAAGELVEKLVIKRSVKIADDPGRLAVFKAGDRVYVRTDNGTSKGDSWELGMVNRVSGKHVYIMLDKYKKDADAEPQIYLSTNVSHLYVSELAKSGYGEPSSFEPGDLVDFKIGKREFQGTVISKPKGRTIAVRYYDPERSKYKERNVNIRLLRLATQSATSEKLPNESRTWTSATGKHTFKGVLVEIKLDAVKIKNSNGKVVEVKCSRLSENDNQYIDEYR